MKLFKLNKIKILMIKNVNLKSTISSDSKKTSINDNIRKNKNDLTKNLYFKFDKKNSSSKPKESETKINNYNSESSNFVKFNNFKTKKNYEKSNNNSKGKYNKNTINSLEDTYQKNDNITQDISSNQHSKNLSNTNENDMSNLNNNNYIYESKLKKNISNFIPQKNEFSNIDLIKTNEIIKNKINNTKYLNKIDKRINQNENNTFFNNNNNYGKNPNKNKKKFNNYEKIDKLFTNQLKNNIINKEDLIAIMNNNINNKGKKKINNKLNNYISTNPNNENYNHNNNPNMCNSEIKSNISINKKYEKSCPKLNFNKNLGFGKTQNNSHSKKLAFEEINEDRINENDGDAHLKKTSIDILKSIKENLIPYYNSLDQNYSNEINNIKINNNNFDSNKKNIQKINNDKNKNIIDLFSPNKEKKNNINNNKIGNLQNIINDDNESINKERMSTQMNNKNNLKMNNNINNNNFNGVKINNKSIGFRKIRTLNEKNEKNSKKDFSINNLALKKRRPRYENELNSNIIDSTNILGNNIKNKNTYLNLIRKAFNNMNKNYYINFLSNKNNINDNELLSQGNNNKLGKNNTFVQKSVRDSKSLNIVRNKSNNNYNNDNIFKKLKKVNEPYSNNLMKVVNCKEHRNFSQNKDYNFRNLLKKENNNFNTTNTNINNENNNIDNSNSKSEIDENKKLENISNNLLNTYSIFINHKYHKNLSKIGLKKIKILDINNNEIPIIFYQTNADYDNGKLFNSIMTNTNLLNKTNNLREDIVSNNIPFITKIKKDIYIYFYINNNQSNIIRFIQIINYNNNKVNPKIYPVKNIEIFNGQNLIYKGTLNNDLNTISISNLNNTFNNNNNSSFGNNNLYQERPFSTSKIRPQKNINNNIKKIITKSDINSNLKNNNKNQIDVYHTARNNLFNRLNDNDTFNIEEYNDNNTKLFRNSEVINKSINSNKKNSNSNNNNTINIHINNNTNNITNLEFIEKNENLSKENDSNFFTMQDTVNNKYSETNNISNDKENNNENDNNNNDNILMTSLNKKMDMTFDQINNSENENNLIEENILTISNMNNQNVKEINQYENNNINNSNENVLFNCSNSSVFNNNYIYFNKIKFVITSNYGHKKHVGLTGIQFYNIRGDLINIETAISIGALPKDLRTVYDDENDCRIFENVFNGFNNTDEVENMWVTKFKKSEPKTFIELYFKDKIKVSKIKFYNYNEKNNLQICAKTIDLYLDDIYYGTIYLKPGVGEIAYDYIKTNINDSNNNEINDTEDGINYYKGEDFGQEITFPIKKNDINNINLISVDNINKNKFDIKYASFLYEQSYETPFMPCGYNIKFEFHSNHYKGIEKDEVHLFKYKDIGLDSIEIYNNDNINILNKNIFNYKIISNCEIVHNKKNKLILNGAQNENGNNCLFYIFEQPMHICYIKFNPLTKKLKPLMNSVKEIKIYCDSRIVFEGDLYIEQPTIVLFTCDMKITKNIDERYLTQKVVIRDSVEIKNDNYFSLILN